MQKSNRKSAQRQKSIYNTMVILYNDMDHDYISVKESVHKICKTNIRYAHTITKRVYAKGSSLCFRGSIEACETVSDLLSDRGFLVRIQSN